MEYRRKSYIGWKGDVTFTGYSEYVLRQGVGEISFGNRDNKADLDAKNVANLIKRRIIFYMEVSAEYYEN